MRVPTAIQDTHTRAGTATLTFACAPHHTHHRSSSSTKAHTHKLHPSVAVTQAAHADISPPPKVGEDPKSNTQTHTRALAPQHLPAPEHRTTHTTATAAARKHTHTSSIRQSQSHRPRTSRTLTLPNAATPSDVVTYSLQFVGTSSIRVAYHRVNAYTAHVEQDRELVLQPSCIRDCNSLCGVDDLTRTGDLPRLPFVLRAVGTRNRCSRTSQTEPAGRPLAERTGRCTAT